MTKTVPDVPRWANLAAHATLLATLPSGLWRIAMGLGVPVGFTAQGLTEFGIPGWGTAYVFGLSLLAEALAFLTLGLVRPWGEVWPRWIPGLRGRRIPPLAAIVPAAAGAIALTLLSLQALSGWNEAGSSMARGSWEDSPVYGVVMAVCYAPLLLWGPLLAAVTVHYARRRFSGERPQHTLEPLGSRA
ncbi:hypothetical protein [Amycolatopsis sp. BJA-103]|uniref:hypothetical protein n=1 Tax=unclassified Amycolatopsis TaxID=2618356 RepID=UPI000C77FA9B|nr:hypothetical protein [Amycolatopsis sp. BJA-103]AUI61496.1 hypothetical protein BKN51_27200 [Amycolatopsis sp. BJA-103]PNE21210.1 hypothetical protein B1H26_05255 [Amycolatopsis sp. BJA-103]